MEEKETVAQEAETEEAVTAAAEEATPDEKTYTAEEVDAIRKKMQADTEKGVQKVIAEKKQHEAVLEAVAQMQADPKSLIEIVERNPRVGNEVLSRFYPGKTIEDYKEAIGYKEDLSDPEVFKRKVEQAKNKALEELKIEQAKDAFASRLELTEKERKEFEAAFAERREMKTFKIDELDKNLEKAYREIDKTDVRALKSKETIAKSMATGEWKGGGESSKKEGPQAEISAFLDKYFN